MKRVSHALLYALSIGLVPCAARSEEQRWDPGNPTTGRLRGEVSPDDRPPSDGVYQRFDGDVTFTLGLGAELGSGARAAVVGRALYYHTGGLIAGYADALGSDSSLDRVLFFGGELRPLFLPRWSLDMQLGVPLVDLTLDSISLSGGMYVGSEEDSHFGGLTGFEAALGFGVPLFASAEGLWLEARGTYRSRLPGSDLGVVFFLSLYETWISPAIR